MGSKPVLSRIGLMTRNGNRLDYSVPSSEVLGPQKVKNHAHGQRCLCQFLINSVSNETFEAVFPNRPCHRPRGSCASSTDGEPKLSPRTVFKQCIDLPFPRPKASEPFNYGQRKLYREYLKQIHGICQQRRVIILDPDRVRRTIHLP